MRIIKSKLVLFAIAIVFCSCGKEKSPDGGKVARNSQYFSLADTVFSVSFNTLALDIDVNATGGWHASSNDAWIAVTQRKEMVVVN